MSPRVAVPGVRMALLSHATRITADEGAAALTLRRLAAESGTSTMAIYTHFGSMSGLRRAVRREGLTALSARLAAARTTGDPVADLVALARAYQLDAKTHPDLFVDAELEEGRDILGHFVRGIDACMTAGRLDPADPACLATQLWAVVHGTVTLQLAGMLTDEEALDCLTCMLNRVILQQTTAESGQPKDAH